MSDSDYSIGIAIPAYKNPLRLRRCLDSIARIDPAWLARTTVVDDSGDGVVAGALKGAFTGVQWIVHEQNKGFVEAANHAVRENAQSIVLLLNDDAELVDDPRMRVTELFADLKLFAVSLRTINEQGETREGAKRLVWRAGIAKILHNPEDQEICFNGVSETAYAVGGHAVYRRSAFLELGGFDSLYYPFYWEDVDLSWRAKQHGYEILYLEDSGVLHHEGGAIKSTHDLELIRRVTWRNRLLFSDRHARGIQRALLPFGIMWQRMTAQLRHDKARLLAQADFRSARNN